MLFILYSRTNMHYHIRLTALMPLQCKHRYLLCAFGSTSWAALSWHWGTPFPGAPPLSANEMILWRLCCPRDLCPPTLPRVMKFFLRVTQKGTKPHLITRWNQRKSPDLNDLSAYIHRKCQGIHRQGGGVICSGSFKAGGGAENNCW